MLWLIASKIACADALWKTLFCGGSCVDKTLECLDVLVVVIQESNSNAMALDPPNVSVLLCLNSQENINFLIGSHWKRLSDKFLRPGYADGLQEWVRNGFEIAETWGGFTFGDPNLSFSVCASI
jgi:hypothetical protein